MSEYLRVAGAGMLADGAWLVWSVADGRRGRRWRAMARMNGRITHALLLEVGTDGRPSRLELTAPLGLLTLHPDEKSRVLHGNVVGADGVRHVRLPWSENHGLEVDGRPIASAVTAYRLANSVAVGEGRAVPVIQVAADLTLTQATHRYARVGPGEWRIEPDSGDAAKTLRIDARGVPRAPKEAGEWPVELD